MIDREIVTEDKAERGVFFWTKRSNKERQERNFWATSKERNERAVAAELFIKSARKKD